MMLKNELARLEIPKKCCEKAELLGLLKDERRLGLKRFKSGNSFFYGKCGPGEKGVAIESKRIIRCRRKLLLPGPEG
jgi:hypothetical protein